MKTWKQFVESKKGCDPHTKKAAEALENMEEKLGKDLDNDSEEGESSAHKGKVLGKSEAVKEQIKESKEEPAKPKRGRKPKQK